MNLLVVESNLQNRGWLEAVLQKGRYHVISAQHGEEALDILQKEHIDGIVSAVFMPVMDGFQLCRTVKLDERWKKIPFIFFTDNFLEGDESFSIDLGADLFLRTTEPQKILSKIKNILQNPGKSQKVLEEEKFFQQYSARLKKELDCTLKEMEKMQERLSQSEIKYQNLFEGSHDATFIMNTEGGHIEANKKASELLGYTLDEFRALSFREIVVPSHIPDSEEKLEKLLQGEDLPVYEKDFKAKDGRIIPVEVSVSGIPDDSGNVIYIQSIVRDITERKKTEHALRESEEKYRNVVEQAASGIAIVQDGVFKYVNPWLIKVTGYTTQELLDTPYTDYIHDQVPKDVGLGTKGGQRAYEAVLTCQDGHIHIEFSVGTTTYRGTPADLFIMRDITGIKRAEKALHKSEEQYRNLFENTPIGIYRTTPDGRILIANPALVRMLGYSSFEELAKRNLEEEGYEAGYPRLDFKKQLEAEGQIIGLESSWKRKDGTTMFFRENAKAVRDDTGAILYYEGTIEDITESKQATEQVRESEERYRNIVEMAPFGILTADLKGTVTSCNTAFTRLTGFPKEDIVGKHLVRLPTIRARDIPRYLKLFGSFIRGTVSMPVEFTWVHEDGTTRLGETHASLIKKGEKTTGVQIIVRDITERKQAEDKLRESEEKYRNIVELAPDGIATLNLKGVITSCNSAFSRLSGFSREELVDKHIAKIPAIQARDIPRFLKLFNSVARGKISQPIEFTWVHKDGTPRLGEARATLIRKEGRITGVQVIARDITERKQTEQQLRESEEKYRNIVELAPDGIATVNFKGIVTSCNTPFLRMAGFSREDIVGKHFTKLPTIRARDIPRYLQILNTLIRGKIPKPIEVAWMHKDRTVRKGEAHISLMKKGEKTTGVQVIVRDITERKQTEEKLKQSEEQYRTLVENLNVGVYRSTPGKKGKFIDVNPAFVNMLGYKEKEEIMNLEVKDIYCSPKDRVQFSRKVSAQGVVKNEELHLKRKDGTSIIVSDTAVTVNDADGTLLYFDGIMEDITERKKMEEALKESEERYRSLVENSRDSIVIIDLKGNVQFANKYTEELTGYTMEEGVGMNVREITPLRYWPKNLNMLKEAITGRPIPYFESVIKRKDGTLIPVESGGQAIFKDGKVVGIQIITRDITERKQAEEELRTYRHHLEELVEERTTELKKTNKQLKKEISERKLMEESLAAEKERLSVTLRSIGDGVITTDIKGKVTLINKAAEQLTGFTQEDAVGNSLSTVFHIIDENTRASCESPVEKVISRGTVAGLGNNTVLIAKDGTERVIADSGAPIRDQNSKVVGVVLVFRDITEKRKMEEEMLKAQKLESIGILAGGIAHDFNNILTAILGNVNLAKVYTAESEVAEKLTRIEKASLQAKDLTQQLLTFSKGGAPIKRTVSIADLIEESTRFALRGSNVRCHFTIPADLWPVEIDEGQISQVINNLVINADQSMPEGGIIQVQAENVAVHLQQNIPLPPGEYVKITIKDRGVGIPAKYLSKIFDPYFTTKQQGSGLGLATTYSIIKQHTGHVDVESEVGVGTTFTVWLPASETIVEPKQEEVSELLAGKGRVLLMDDEEIIREAAGEALQGLGYDVEVVKDGAEAITQYKNAQKAGTPFDVVIMDLTIPGGMGGRETVASLLEIDPEAKAIVSSGYSNDPIMADYKAHGFKGVVAKPYSVEELSKTLRNVIEGENPTHL